MNQRSFAATSAALSDKSAYPLFWRTSPSDVHQGDAAVSVMKEFGWQKVSTVATDDSYAAGLAAQFGKDALAQGIAVAAAVTLPQSSPADLFNTRLAEVKKAGSGVNFMASIGDDATDMMSAAQTNGMTGPG